MAPPKPPMGGSVQDVMKRFRDQQKATQQTLVKAAQEREERLKKSQASNKQQQQPRKKPASRTKSTTSSGLTAASKGDQNKADDWKVHLTQPLGLRQKHVVDFLKQRELPATVAEIAASTGQDINRDTELKSNLQANPKISYDADQDTYSYQPDANVRNKQQLLEYIRKSITPIAVNEVEDAYKKVMEDIESLQNDGLIIALHSYDPSVGCSVLFPVDVKMKEVMKPFDEDVTALWNGTELPDDDDEVAVMLKNNYNTEPAQHREVKKRTDKGEKKRKKRKASKLRAVTNAHLMHLLEGEAPVAIDGDVCN